MFQNQIKYSSNISHKKHTNYKIYKDMKKQLSILFLFLSVVTFAQEIRFARIDSLLNYLYENDKFMGSLCIRQGDEVVFKQAYGFSEATKGVRANGVTK